MSETRFAVVGAAGRMGLMLIKAIHEAPQARLSAALEHPHSLALGHDAGLLAGIGATGVMISSDATAAFAASDAVLDFSVPEATVAFAALAARYGLVHVVGTTGVSESDLAHLAEAARKTAVIRSGNMSLGVNLLASLVKKAAAAMDASFDIEIVEMHHRAKVDAPSGTALLLGEAAAAGREVALSDKSVRARDGHTGARKSGDIGFASLRGGSVIGDHTVVFAGNGERIELRHIAEERGLFAQGAVRAALWGRNQPPGLYSMADVLGLGH